jgi:hypothetical protein
VTEHEVRYVSLEVSMLVPVTDPTFVVMDAVVEEVVETLVVTVLEHVEFRAPPPSPHISLVSSPEGTLIVATDQAIGSEGTVKL